MAAEWKCLQDLLKARAESEVSGSLLFYSNGNTTSPEKISYSVLHQLAKKTSVVIQSFGAFAKNRSVLLHFDDHWDTILWFWAVLLADGLPVLSSPFSNVEDHRRKHIRGLSTLLKSPVCITRSKSRQLFGDDHGLHLYDIESLEGAAQSSLPATVHLNGRNGVVDTPNGAYVNGQGHNDDQSLAMLMLTSGSTGNSKAVRITHRQVLASVAGKSGACSLPPGRSFLNWIGLDHVGALVEIHLHALWLGVDQVHVPAVDMIASPRTFLDLLSRHRVSRSFAPNFFLARLVATVDSKSASSDPAWDLSNLQFMVSGGEANDVKTCVAVSSLFAKYGAPPNAIVPGFGMTETCAGSIYNTNCPRYDVAGGRAVASLGKCIEGMEMRVATSVPGTSDHRLALPGEFGELQVRGPVVFEGYYRNAEATAKAFTSDGWFCTGDQATIDENGNLHLVGRVNEVININGIKIIAADLQTSLEQALGSRVVRLVVFGTRAAHTEQITIAYIPPGRHPMSAQGITDIDRLATEVCMLSTSSRPLVFALREESIPLLPISALGKISRAKMKSLFEAGEFAKDLDLYTQTMKLARQELPRSNEISDAPGTEAEALLVSDFAEVLGTEPDTFSVNASVFEQGFTSMDLIKLKHRIDTRLGITVPIIVLMKNPTARSLAAALRSEKLAVNGGAAPSSAVYDPVVTFHATGQKTPLWLVHPGVGEVLVFIGLARRMGDDDRPLLALRAPGFDKGQRRLASIADALDTYVAAIRQRQPRGPYALAGYSYGAMLAFEMAKRLEAEDGWGSVRFLASFNLPPNIKHRMRYLNWNMCLLNLAYFLGLTTTDKPYAAHPAMDEAAFRELPQKKALAQVLAVAEHNRMEELGLEEQGLVRWVDIAHGLESMATNYDPTGNVGSIDVFHAEPLRAVASSREEWMRLHLSKWADFSRAPPAFHEVGGAHYTMLDADHVDGFAAKLKAALEARGV